MLPKPHILVKGASAIIMIAALLFLTTANFWTYGLKKEKKIAVSIPNPTEEEPCSKNAPPNPVEEKSSNGLQNLSEYLHDYHHPVIYPVNIRSFGNRHDIINYPIQHLDLITPPPKSVA